ncbi:MAG: hypothetical protein ACRDR6_31065, partial [Pseudonocardiaceae bacterium]
PIPTTTARRKAYPMPIPRMDAHMRVGVLRCDGCWSAVTAELPATPSARGDARPAATGRGSAEVLQR